MINQTEKQISYQFHTAMAVWYRAKDPTLAAWHLEQAARAQA